MRKNQGEGEREQYFILYRGRERGDRGDRGEGEREREGRAKKGKRREGKEREKGKERVKACSSHKRKP